MGAGALIVSQGRGNCTPSLRGGGQEQNRRGGTPSHCPPSPALAAALIAP